MKLIFSKEIAFNFPLSTVRQKILIFNALFLF